MNSIFKKERIGFTFTIIQQLIFTCIFCNLVNSHVKILYRPFSFSNVFFKPSTLFYILSITLPVYLKYLSRSRNIPFLVLCGGYTLSTLFFTTHFPTRTFIFADSKSNSFFIFKKILINIIFCINFSMCLINGTILAFDTKKSVFEFTKIEGIFKYFALCSKKMLNRILNLWFINLSIFCAFLFSYVFCLGFLVNFILIFIRCELVNTGRIFSNLIMLSFSLLMYLFFIEFFDRLLIFNLSIKCKQLMNFSSDTNVFIRRYTFYHVSNLSTKYTYVFNSLCRSKTDLFNLFSYIEKECAFVKEVCKKIIEEYQILDSRLYMTIPQVNVNGSYVVKKYKNYNFIYAFFYKLYFNIKIFMLRVEFRKCIKYMEDINQYMNYLLKQRDYYMLLGDVDKKYTEIYENLIEEIRNVEEKCRIDLKVRI